jgi:predicted phosphodiesterase
MRIAAVSDIHGNLPALEAVLADIARLGADVTVNLGDIASGPLWPRETIDRLAALALPTIAGNHERQVLTDPPERMSASDAFAAAAITDEQRAWMRALPATRWLAADVLLCHGTPTSDADAWLETVVPGPLPAIRPALASEIAARAAGAGDDLGDATLVLCGHSHVPRIVQLDERVLVVNPGSVGLPAYEGHTPHPHVVETGSPHARYALIERGAGGGWHVSQRAVTYDWHASAARAAAGDRPEWALALRTGRVTT